MDELARNLCAAYLAYAMGLKSIDYTKKTYVSEKEIPVGAFWLALAKRLDTGKLKND